MRQTFPLQMKRLEPTGVNDLLKVTQVVCDMIRIQTQAVWYSRWVLCSLLLATTSLPTPPFPWKEAERVGVGKGTAAVSGATSFVYDASLLYTFSPTLVLFIILGPRSYAERS